MKNMSKKQKLLHLFIWLVLIGLLSMLLFSCNEKAAGQLVKVELVDGTYTTDFELGQKASLVGAQLKLSFNNGTVKYIQVNEEMTQINDQAKVNTNIAYAHEHDVQYDSFGRGSATIKQDIFAKYQQFIVKAPVSITTDNYIEVTTDGAIKKYNGTTPLAIVDIPESITTNDGTVITITKISSGNGFGAFRNASIAQIYLPATIQYIDVNSFWGCRDLNKVVFKTNSQGAANLAVILAGAFNDCLSLTSIDLPKSLIGLSREAFRGCLNLNSINIEEGSPNYYTPYASAFEGVVYQIGEVAVEDIAYENAYIWPLGKGHSTISFMSGGDLVQQYNGPAGQIVSLENLVRENYEFKGWYLEDNFINKVEQIIVQNNDLTLYALWSPISYQITYYLNEGINAVGNPSSYTIESPTIELLHPTKVGYDFYGWLPANNIESGSTGNLSFFASWTPTIYQINYDLDGGLNHLDNINYYNIESPTFNLLSPSKIGYVFNGWYQDGQAITSVLNGSVGDFYLLAAWTTDAFLITYLDAGIHQNPSSYTIEQAITLSAPSKPGYTFIQWSPFDYIAPGTAENLEFIALWSVTTYTINYELDGGINNEANPLTYNIESPAIELLHPTKVGYDFLQWSPNSLISSGSVGNKTFRALWKVITYQINYDLNGGVNSLANPTSYNIESADIVLSNPTKRGYNFLAWSPLNLILSGSTQDLTFTALWSAISYPINYLLNGGTNEPTNPNFYTIEDDLTILNPSRNGYTFAGWTPNNHIEINTIGEKVFSANWDIVYYSISYVLESDVQLDRTNPTEYTIETPTFWIKDPVRLGYIFMGWNLDSEVAIGSFGDLEFIPNWSLIHYNITYLLNGGVNNPNNPVTYTIIDDTIPLFEPTKPGYHFMGWLPHNRIITGTSGDLEFSASWANNVYQVIYNANGGEGKMKNSSIIFGQPSLGLLLTNAFSKIGYSFAGWGLNTDIVSYTDRQDLSNFIGTHGQTIYLYAIWQANTYLINYLSDNSNEGSMSPSYYLYDSNFVYLSPNSFIKYGYDFVGWSIGVNADITYVDQDLITNEMLMVGGYPQDINLYTQWAVASYLLNFNYYENSNNHNDYANTEQNSQIVTFGSVASFPAPTRIGYTFEGWYLSDQYLIEEKLTYGYKDTINNSLNIGDGIEAWGFYNLSKTKANNVYAKWEVITYKLMLNFSHNDYLSFTINEEISRERISSVAYNVVMFGLTFKDIALIYGSQISTRTNNSEFSVFENIGVGTYVSNARSSSGLEVMVSSDGTLLINASVDTWGIVYSITYINEALQSDNGTMILNFDNYIHSILSRTIIIKAVDTNVTFQYLKDKTTILANLNIIIEPRSEKLNINFDNFQFSAPENKVAILSTTAFELEITYLNNNMIKGGSGSNGLSMIFPPTDILGTAPMGGNGTNNSGGAYKSEEELRGGDGRDAIYPGRVGTMGDSGRDGEDGKAAIKTITAPKFKKGNGTSQLQIIGGDGGSGGNAANGGKGQQGGQGGTGGDGGSSFHFYGVVAFYLYGKGGKGGNGSDGGQGGMGGIGGHGGDSGSAIEYSSGIQPNVSDIITRSGIAGAGGNKGLAGAGGQGGLPGIGGKGGNGDSWQSVINVLSNGFYGFLYELNPISSNKAGDLGRPGNKGIMGIDGINGARGADAPEIKLC